MKKIILVALFFLFMILVGCATPYQQQGFRGGFSDFRIDSNTFRVQFRGNAYTSKETVELYALYRCAEVTLEAGFDYFFLVGERGEVYQDTVATPDFYQSRYSHGRFGSIYIPSQYIQMTKHGSFLTIKAFKGQKPKNAQSAFDAHEMVQYLGEKVGRITRPTEHSHYDTSSPPIKSWDPKSSKMNPSPLSRQKSRGYLVHSLKGLPLV